MADEITITTGVTVANGSLQVRGVTSSTKYDMATVIAPAPGGVTVGTSEETISFGDVTPGWTEIVNLDDTNYVEFGFSTGVYGMVLPAGGSMVFKMNGLTLYAKADTASVNLQVTGISN